jgi:hypothetical protein
VHDSLWRTGLERGTAVSMALLPEAWDDLVYAKKSFFPERLRRSMARITG